jgi:hypothetical protein
MTTDVSRVEVPRRARPRRSVGRRTLIVGALLGPLTVVAGTARAAWQAGGAGTVTVPATALPAGAAPAATVSGQDVDLSWAAATMDSAVVSYQIRRYDASTGVQQPIGSACDALTVDLSCREAGVPAGNWTYRVTPVYATWVGAPSPDSATVTTTAAASDLANGDFETGSLSPWTSTPAPSSSGASVENAFNGYQPHGGSYFAVVAPEGQDTYTHLAQPFTATAGQTVSGWAFFDGQDYLPFDDDGAVVIQQDGSDLATVFAASIGTLGNHGKTGWTAWSYTVPSSGTYTVDARVRNRGDGSVPSYLGLDDVTVQ